MTHFLRLCYNVFILEYKIDALVFRKICVKMCYITLEIALGFLLVKLSVNGACVAHLFQPSSWSEATKVWKNICRAEHNFLNEGTFRAAQLQMWAAFEDI
jgi:hypothetical protein